MKVINGQLGVKVMLAHGHFLALVFPEAQARQLLQAWVSGHLLLKGRPTISHEDFPAEPGSGWGCRVGDIVGMHLFSLEKVQQQQQQQGDQPRPGSQPAAGGWPLSGGPN